jgi:arsenite methyltransferase
MKAAWYETQGTAETVLTIGEMPDPNPGPGEVRITHGWGTAVWHSGNADRTDRIMTVWDGHLADPFLPRTLFDKLTSGGFRNVGAEAFVQLDTGYDASSASAILIGFIADYAVSQGFSQSEADVWLDDLRTLGASYFCTWNEYIFTAEKS